MLKVDGIPFQAHHLATAKSVKGSHQHRQLQLGSPKGFKHLLHLVRREKDRLKAVLSGPVHLVRHILDQHIGLDCIFQCRVNDGVIVDDGIGRDPLEHFRIKHLQMSGFQFPQCQFLLAKIRDDGAFQQSLIGTVGCVGQPSLGDLQPFQQIVGEQHITAQVAHFFGRLKLRSEPCQF